MRLHCIDEITNGLQVFMPSGFVATLYKDPEKKTITVTYPDGLETITNVISYKDFEELIQDGISSLRDDLSLALSVSESLNEDELDDELEADRITKWDSLKEELLSEDFDCSDLYDSFGYMTSRSEYGAELRSDVNNYYMAVAGCFDPWLRFDTDDLRLSEKFFQSIYNSEFEYNFDYLFRETKDCFLGTEYSGEWKIAGDDDYGYRTHVGLTPDCSSFKLNEIGVDRIIEQLKNPSNEDDESLIDEWLYEDGRDIADDISSNNLYSLDLDDDCFEFNQKFMKDLYILANYVEGVESGFEDINYWKELIEANEWVDVEWEEEHAEQSEDEENEDVRA